MDVHGICGLGNLIDLDTLSYGSLLWCMFPNNNFVLFGAISFLLHFPSHVTYRFKNQNGFTGQRCLFPKINELIIATNTSTK